MKCPCCNKNEATVKFRSIKVCGNCDEILINEENNFRGSDLEEYEDRDEEGLIVPKVEKKKNPVKNPHLNLQLVEKYLPFAVLKLLITSKRNLIKKTVFNALKNSFQNVKEHEVYLALDQLKKNKMVIDDITGFAFTEKGKDVYKTFSEKGGEQLMILQNPISTPKKNPRKMERYGFTVTVTDYYIYDDGKEIYVLSEKTVHPDYRIAIVSQNGKSVITHVSLADIYKDFKHHTKRLESVLPAEEWVWVN